MKKRKMKNKETKTTFTKLWLLNRRFDLLLQKETSLKYCLIFLYFVKYIRLHKLLLHKKQVKKIGIKLY